MSSKSSKNVTTSKVRSTIISDVNESSQTPRPRSDMSTTRTFSSKDTHPKSSVEDFFDSGIQSESSLSSGIISEADLKYGNSSADCVCDSRTLSSRESLDGAKAEYSYCDNLKLELADSIRMDSGIDVDLHYQPNGSKYDYYRSAELASSANITRTCIVRKPSAARKAPYGYDENPWSSIFQPDEDGNTQLHLAIIQGYGEYVRKILQHIPDPRYLNIQNYYRQTCVHLSVLMNQPETTRLLLLAGAKTGIEDRNGNTALHLACQMNFSECVKALLSPVTVYEQKYIVFQYKPVIDSPDAHINEYNYDGISCIHMAAAHPDLEILHQLFLSGADVNIRECKGGYTILHNAVRSGNFNLVRCILQHSGIDVEKKNYARLTPYQLSAFQPRISEILLDKGASRLFTVDDESDDEDYSSDESDSDDNLFEIPRAGSSRVNEVTDMINTFSMHDNAIVSTS